MTRRSRPARPDAPALAVSVALHAAVVAALIALARGDKAPEPVTAEAPMIAGVVDPEQLATVELIDDEAPMGPRPVPVDGSGDQAAVGMTHPLPGARADLPGQAAAARGGGDPGGDDSFTGRRDIDTARAELWNGGKRYRIARRDDARRQTTPESLSRAPSIGAGDRRVRRALAHTGQLDARDGTSAAGETGAQPAIGAPERDWVDADPRFDRDPARARPRAQDGSTSIARERPLVARGAVAVEAPSRGESGDVAESAAASDERDPMPLEVSVPSAGGIDRGVAGPSHESGLAASGRRNGRGSAATRARVARGAGALAVRADRQNDYFRRMYRRLDALVVYPPELALSLEQGVVIVTFTLFADGKIGDVTVAKSSGFKQFDRAVTRALGKAAPFGKVPTSVRGTADRVTVNVPYTFSNPVIR